MKPLTRRAIIALLRMPIAMGLLTFLPARTFLWWQGWVYVLIIMGCILHMTLYLLWHDPALLERRLRAGPFAETQWSQKIILVAAVIFTVAMYVMAGNDFHHHRATLPAWLVLAADAAYIINWAVIIHPTFRANSFAASTIRVESSQHVVDTGPYAWVRHPMYSGASLSLLLTPIALGSLSALVPAALLVAVIVARLLSEERYLVKNLPGYEAYRHRVRWRLIPWVF